MISLLATMIISACDGDQRGSRSMIRYRDSVLTAFTYRMWVLNNWSSFNDPTREYDISMDDLQFRIPAAYYSPDSLQFIAIVTVGKPNAYMKQKILPVQHDNTRICPTAGDTVYSAWSVVGFRVDVDSIWALYPLLLQGYTCYHSEYSAVRAMTSFLAHTIRERQVWFPSQSGSNAGEVKLHTISYGLDDGLVFWRQSLVWQRDTVGADSLYPFQVENYETDENGHCFKCARPLILPRRDLPAHILSLFDIH